MVCGKKKCVYVKKNSKSKKQFIKCKGIYMRLTYYIKEKTKKLKTKKQKSKKGKRGGIGLKWPKLSYEQKKNQVKYMEPFNDYNKGVAKAVNGAELINMSSEHNDVKRLFPPLNNGYDYQYYLWDGRIRIPKPAPQPTSKTLNKNKIVMSKDTITKPPDQKAPVVQEPEPRVVEAQMSKSCKNPRIFMRIENKELKSFNGCDATMENCSAIFFDRDGKKRYPPPNLQSYFYDPNPNSPGCRLRCPGMVHEINKDYKNADGEVVNVCKQLGTTPGGRRGDTKRKKRNRNQKK